MHCYMVVQGIELMLVLVSSVRHQTCSAYLLRQKELASDSRTPYIDSGSLIK